MAEKMIKVIAKENGVGQVDVRKGDTIEIPETSLKQLVDAGIVEGVPKGKEAPRETPKEAPKKKK